MKKEKQYALPVFDPDTIPVFAPDTLPIFDPDALPLPEGAFLARNANK